MFIKGLLIIVFLFTSYLSAVELTQNEQEYIRKFKTLSVCVDPDWEPFEILDKQGNYTGIGADLLFLVAQRLGINVEILHTKDWKESIEASKQGKCQIVSFLNQTPQREEWLLFTEVHFTDPNVFITREEHPFIANLSYLANETMVFPSGTAMEERIRMDYQNLKILTTPTEMEAFNMVSHKKADIAMRSLIVAAYTIKKEGLFNLKIAGQLPNYTNQFRMGVIKTEPLLRTILNKAIETITNEDKARIVTKYIVIQAQMERDYSLLFQIVIGFLLLSFLAIYRYRELKKYNTKLLYLSETDLLTQLYNRQKIENELTSQLDRAKRNHHELSILLLDIDNFKAINDTFGHLTGDKILIEISHILKENIRNYDSVGRWGGEEFLVICPESTLNEALGVANRIEEKIREKIFSTQKKHTLSMGVAVLSDEDTLYSLLQKADKALYRAKEEGRNQICVFTCKENQ